MEPIHLRSSIAQSQEVSRLQRVSEHLDDHGRQALVREAQESQRREKVEPPPETEGSRVGEEQQAPTHDPGDGAAQKPPKQDTTDVADRHDRPAKDPDRIKGRFLDVMI